MKVYLSKPGVRVRRLVAPAALFGLLAVAGCVVAPPNPFPPPPAPRVEVVPPPRPGQVQTIWQPGQWHWNGAGYVWIPGHYVERVVGTSRWEPGHWALRRGAYVWIPGRWI